MNRNVVFWIAVLMLLLLGCGGAAPIRSSSSAAAPEPGAPPGAAEPTAMPDAERPGLGTAFGESRESRSRSAKFERDRSEPLAVATLWYNDTEGARAMSASAGYREEGRPVVPVLDGMITMRIEGENGQVLPGFVADGKTYVIGQEGARYVVLLQNHTGYRFEIVASVDGLDVIDGRPAAFSKRGYILHPNSTLAIEGFRTSESTIAAFRFSSVRGSYTAKSGQGDQNVGVIGAAIFNEAGVTPVWNEDEVNRRKDANPFPGGYAQPPSR